MKQQTSQKNKWAVQFPPNEKVTRFGRESLNKACYGNDRIGSLLNYFIYQAGYEIKQQSLPESCNVVVFARKLNEILERLNFDLSKKTLIRYLDLLNEWGYVGSERYQKVYTVNLEAIQTAINTPPDKPKRPAYNRNANKKSCKSTTLQPTTNETVELRGKVEELQQKVDYLQQKVDQLHQIVDNLSTLQPLLTPCIQAPGGTQSEPHRNLELHRISIEEGTYGANAPVVTDQHTSSLFPENELPPLETMEPEPPVSPNGSNGKNPDKPNKPAGKEKGKGKGNVTNDPPAAKPKTGLDAHTEQEKAFWALWLNADQNKKVPPPYKDSAFDHIKTLAPQITTQEQMDSLVTFSREKTRKKLNLPSLWKIELGNLRNCFSDWDREQQKQNSPPASSPLINTDKVVLWTRKPDSPLFKIDPSAWFLFEEMPLAEAKQYNYDLYGGLPGDVQTRIRVNYQREERGELKRPELVA